MTGKSEKKVCGAKGPAGLTCTRPKGHVGVHAGPGVAIGPGCHCETAYKYKVWGGKLGKGGK